MKETQNKKKAEENTTETKNINFREEKKKPLIQLARGVMFGPKTANTHNRCHLCQENCSARTDSILLCGFETVL